MTRLARKTRLFVTAQGRLTRMRETPYPELFSLGLFFLLPTLVITLKLLPVPALAPLRELFSLTTLPDTLARHAQRLMLMSVGAVVVVFVRLTLGLRVLGPVRPILIAVAYQIAGFAVATVFLVGVMGIIAVVRPILRQARLAYFGRIAMILSLVTFLILLALKLSLLFGADGFLTVGLLPVVVLTFAAEGFAKTLQKEGVKSASWRALMTIAVAVSIHFLVSLPHLQTLTLRFPEVIFLEMGLIYVVARFFKFRCLDSLNPRPKKVRVRQAKSSKVKNKSKVARKATRNTNQQPHQNQEVGTA